MTDLARRLSALRRPRLLIRAARFGLAEYDRSRDLRRLLRVPVAPGPLRALAILIDEEARLDGARQAGDPAYRPGRHVEMLIALMGEARLLPRPQPDQAKASGISALRRATNASNPSRMPASSAGGS